MRLLTGFLIFLLLAACQKPLLRGTADGDDERFFLRHFYARNNIQNITLPDSLQTSQVESLRGLPWLSLIDYRGELLFTTHNGFLYSGKGLDDLGKLEVSEGISGIPALLGDTLFVSSARGKNGLVAYNARSGEIIWEKRGLLSESAPLAMDGRVFHAALNGRLIAYDTNGEQLWENHLEHAIRAPLAGQDGKLVVATADGEVRCYHMQNGTLAWAINLASAVLAAPMIYENNVYLPAYDGSLHAINLDSGERVWRKELGTPIYYSPSGVDGVLYIGLPNRLVLALDAADGNEIWRSELDGPPTAPPLVTDGEVLLGTAQKSLFRLGRENGRKIQRLKLEAKPRSTPRIYGGKLYISMEPDLLAVIGEKK